VSGLWLLATGVGGLALAFLWFISEHVATVWNLNLCYLSPLALLMVAAAWRATRRRPHRIEAWAAVIVLLCVVVGVVMTMIGVQQNQVLAQLTALPTVVVALDQLSRFTRRPGGALPTPRGGLDPA
jgi:peptidoglycan/LPS O-acetylase OafA/YrhL